MAETLQSGNRTRRWTMRAAFVALALAVMVFNLMPLETVPRRWAGPDLLLALTFAWTLRRPDYAPALAVGLLMLLADLLFQRPPGLMAALVVMACEWLKGHARTMRELPFPAEWLAATAAMTAVLLGYRVILAIMFSPLPPLGLSVLQLLASVAVYPLVVLLSVVVFGLRKMPHAGAERTGGLG